MSAPMTVTLRFDDGRDPVTFTAVRSVVLAGGDQRLLVGFDRDHEAFTVTGESVPPRPMAAPAPDALAVAAERVCYYEELATQAPSAGDKLRALIQADAARSVLIALRRSTPTGETA